MAVYPEYEAVRRIAVLGTGTIGASWTAWFLSRGYAVDAWDPADDWQQRLAAFIGTAWPHLEALGLAPGADRTAVTPHATASDAVASAGFVQENAPEKPDVKRALYRDIDQALPDGTILSSSTSGLIMSDLQAGLASAGRFVVGHPFNPPHLIPLVEVVAGRLTDPAAADWAVGFYGHVGKHAIRVRKEVPGHLANRLQAALFREAVLAVRDGLASVEDVDAAVSRGPGLRWALMGPHMIMNLAGGRAGYRGMLEHFGPGMQAWWETMTDNPVLGGALADALVEGVAEEARGRDIAGLEAERDARLIALLRMVQNPAAPGGEDPGS